MRISKKKQKVNWPRIFKEKREVKTFLLGNARFLMFVLYSVIIDDDLKLFFLFDHMFLTQCVSSVGISPIQQSVVYYIAWKKLALNLGCWSVRTMFFTRSRVGFANFYWEEHRVGRVFLRESWPKQFFKQFPFTWWSSFSWSCTTGKYRCSIKKKLKCLYCLYRALRLYQSEDAIS